MDYFNNIHYNNVSNTQLNMEKQDALKLLKCQNLLNHNQLPKELIDDCYKLIPDTIPDTFQRVKVQAIQRFLTFNMDIISKALIENEMNTTITVDQSPTGEKKGRTSTRPKVKPKPKTKTGVKK